MHLIINCCYKLCEVLAPGLADTRGHENLSDGVASLVWAVAWSAKWCPCTRRIKHWPQTANHNVAYRTPYASFTCFFFRVPHPLQWHKHHTSMCVIYNPVDLQRTQCSFTNLVLLRGCESGETNKKKWTSSKKIKNKRRRTCEFPCKQVKEISGGAEEVERMHWFTLIL